MTVKRVKVTDGVFTWDRIRVDVTKPHKNDADAIQAIIKAAGPFARIDSLRAFADGLKSSGKLAAFVDLRLKALRSTLAETEITSGRERLALIDKAELLRREIEALPYIRKGMQFAGSKRGLSRLYREAVAILEREGADISAKRVWSALLEAGVIRFESESLHWTDDKGIQKKTSMKQFESGLSRHRKLIR